MTRRPDWPASKRSPIPVASAPIATPKSSLLRTTLLPVRQIRWAPARWLRSPAWPAVRSHPGVTVVVIRGWLGRAPASWPSAPRQEQLAINS